MRIRRLLARGFGSLRGEFRFAADRVNLVLEPNERGKTTLASAILAGLYGFPPGQRRSENRPFPDLELHRPWNGGEYLVEIDVEADGRAFTIRRDFGRGEERVVEFRTGRDLTAEFQTSRSTLAVAEALCGLDREDFSRTVLVRQRELEEVRDASGLTAALQKMATSQQGDVAAAEAIETLRSATRLYRGKKIRRGRVESEIAEIDDEIESLSRNLRSMEERRREAESRLEDLERTSNAENRVEGDLRRVEYLILAAGRREDAARLEEEMREKLELEEREAEFQDLDAWSSFPADAPSRLREGKARVEALASEEERTRARCREEIDDPLGALEEQLREAGAAATLAAEDLARFSAAETDLAAAWRARRDARRDLRATRERLRSRGSDPDRIRSLSDRLASLTPDDRRFLLGVGEKEVAARSAVLDAEREKERLEAAVASAADEIRRRGAAGNAAAIAAGLLAAAGAALWFLGPRPWAWAAFAAALVAAFVHGALGSDPEAAARERALREELAAAALGIEERAREIEGLRDRLQELARSAGFGTGEEYLAAFREAESHGDEASEQAALLRRIGESEAALRSAASSVAAVMEAAAYRPRRGAVTPRTARAFRARLASHRETAARIEGLRERRRGVEEQLASLAREKEGLLREVAGVLIAAGLDRDLPLDAAIERAEESVARRDRYEVLKREVIPALVRRSLGHKGEPLRRSVEVADGVLRRRLQEDPGLASLIPEKSHKEYVEERDRMRQESRSLVERRLQLSNDLGEVLKEYRRDYPDTLRWLGEWKEQRDRAEAFRAAVERASAVLEEISREAYAEWADLLNVRASETLGQISPGWDDLRFDEDLSFSVRDLSDGSRRSREEVDYRLSAGARDQIYLAARLAFAGYLSSGRVKLPLILDDPFTSFDDERFGRAMDLLVDKISRKHQVILLSCHEARHRSWQERNAERFAERIRVMTLQAPAV